MTIPATNVAVSGERLVATYVLSAAADRARAVAEAITVEQTIEFPLDLVADDDIRRQVVGRIETVDEIGPRATRVDISYAAETIGRELPQLLNVLFGNVSLFPGVRLVDLKLPPDLLSAFRGPRFGVAGLRTALGVRSRPFVASALKPMGLGPEALARIAATLARAGIDIVKDDHGLANQPFAEYRERVRRCAEAVRRANEETGGHCVYLPSLNAPAAELKERVRIALDAGVGGFLVLPGLCGFDTMRALAEETQLPVMAHPSFLGANVTHDGSGVAHGVLFGTLMRLGGADITIFPGYGGRFTFDRATCRSIADAARAPLGDIRPILPAPAGGTSLERVAELVEFYGPDTVLLIGGDLHRGDLLENARRLRAAVGG